MAAALQLPELAALRALSADGRLLLATRVVRLFAFGFLAVVLALYLAALGLREAEIGLLLTLTLAGDATLSLLIATVADRLGRRRMLLLSGGLMLLAGLALALSTRLALVIAAAVVGTLSPSGGEVGPAAALEQAALPQTVPDSARTAAFAWYNLAGSFATALGSLAGGALVAALPAEAGIPLLRYRVLLAIYGLLGMLLMLLAAQLSSQVEAPPRATGEAPPARAWLGLERSRAVVLRLAALFALDAFAGGLVVQSLLAFGNGGWATDAQHVAVEFIHPVIVGKRALPALALTNGSAALTGSSFARQRAVPDHPALLPGAAHRGPAWQQHLADRPAARRHLLARDGAPGAGAAPVSAHARLRHRGARSACRTARS